MEIICVLLGITCATLLIENVKLRKLCENGLECLKERAEFTIEVLDKCVSLSEKLQEEQEKNKDG